MIDFSFVNLCFYTQWSTRSSSPGGTLPFTGSGCIRTLRSSCLLFVWNSVSYRLQKGFSISDSFFPAAVSFTWWQLFKALLNDRWSAVPERWFVCKLSDTKLLYIWDKRRLAIQRWTFRKPVIFLFSILMVGSVSLDFNTIFPLCMVKIK